MAAPRTVFTAVNLPLDERAALEATATALGVSRSAVIRAGLRSIYGADGRDVARLVAGLPADGRKYSGQRERPCGVDAVLAIVPPPPQYVDQADLAARIGGNWRAILKDLLAEGRIIRIGRGVRHEPYRYHLAPVRSTLK